MNKEYEQKKGNGCFMNSTKEKRSENKKTNSGGFTLVEVVIALMIFLVAVFGVFMTFAYAINRNAGNNTRARALTVLQKEIELLRSAKFTPQVTDATLIGGKHADKTVTSIDNYKYLISTTVDNDPFASGIQDDSAVAKPTLKEISVTVTLASPTPGWQTAVPATIILRRVRAN